MSTTKPNNILIVSSKDVDVRTTEEIDLLLESERNNMMYIMDGTASYTFNSEPSAVGEYILATIHHGLGYIPMVDVKYTPNQSEYVNLPTLYKWGGKLCPNCEQYLYNDPNGYWNYCDSTYCLTNLNNAYAYNESLWNSEIASCDATWEACLQATGYNFDYCDPPWNACYDAALNRWIDRDNAAYDTYLSCCDSVWSSFSQGCFDNAASYRSQMRYKVNNQDLIIYLNLFDFFPSPTCGWPAGSRAYMNGVTLRFAYKIFSNKLE